MKYESIHRNRVNLLLHLAAVPWFISGTLTIFWSIFKMDWSIAGYGLVQLSLSMAAQAYGHSLEAKQPDSSTGAWDLFKRILFEQFYRFPRFVLGGGWLSNWSKS